ncbi:MAG: FAD-dependent oxidoreductase, partial [Gammaproteobacteria bacterium]|nr:FAD-dependent oxidoreductase [Gammaproteobacteria bacterium]
IIVVGGGHAAAQLLDTLRREGFRGRLSLVSEEAHLPYQRPHLSKLYLAGQLQRDKLLYRPAAFYTEQDIDVRLNVRASALDCRARTITLKDGDTLHYDGLALTTGARVRRMQLDGETAGGVYYLRTIEDTDRIRSAVKAAQRIVFIGGGFLGLEAAGVLTSAGKSVTVLEIADRVMAGAVGPEISAHFEALHREQGVSIRTATAVTGISVNADNHVTGITTAGGDQIPADVVIISIGVEPNAELALDAGLHCDNGICVDEHALTSDPAVVAAGDCTAHPNAFVDRQLRLESVHNAVEQAKTAAASLAGLERPYRQVPWFWSDQYDRRLQMVGVPQADDQRIVRGNPDSGSFAVLYFRDGRLTGCHAVNRPADYMSCRKLMENRIDLSVAQAGDLSVDLRDLVPARTPLAFQRRGAGVA